MLGLLYIFILSLDSTRDDIPVDALVVIFLKFTLFYILIQGITLQMELDEKLIVLAFTSRLIAVYLETCTVCTKPV